MYVQCNNEARSRIHCYRAHTTSITCSESLFVASVMQNAKQMRILYCYLWPVWLYHIILLSVACLAVPYYIVICGLSGCTILYCYLWPVWLYHIIPRFPTNDTIFGRKKIIEHKMYVLSLCTNFV